MDHDPWIGDLLAHLVRNRHPESPLWPLSPVEIISNFQTACASLGLQHLSPCRYSLRHGGASDDLLTLRRDLAAVKKRGRWASDSSLKRYTKEIRLLAELHKVPKPVIAYGELVQLHLKPLLLGLIRLPAPPSLPVTDPVPGPRPKRSRK